ncbi:cell wall metabolism sensor histidine kinase WalK [Actinomyces slackii]|uniref:histidine kinase n=2 Tax=Actinomyces slackii TaxID=52774 RepID=A0A3S4U1F4_9ACTO|nr:Probable sensor histidine kinase TcrY [Actinomyces slackii]
MPPLSHRCDGAPDAPAQAIGPTRPATRRVRSLRTRLVAGVVGLVLIMAAIMGALSTITLHHTLMRKTDEQLFAASERATGDPAPAPQSTVAPSDPDEQHGSSEHNGDDDRGLPPGLRAAGQSTGTLRVVLTGQAASRDQDGKDSRDDDESQEDQTFQAAYIDNRGRYTALSADACAELLDLTPNSHPETVHIKGLGDYRVMANLDPASGSTVITGLSLEANNGLVRTQMLIEAIAAALGALIMALAGRAMVRSSLAPLERVASTAQRVAAQPLERGEVSIEERVTDADLASSSEVGQVGTALNTLLGHVEAALAARQRSETQVRQFVADASHELRTPLASIRGYTELVQRESPPDLTEDAERALDRVHSESLRMTALVEDLLLLARLDAGREVEREEVDLVEILIDTVADAQAAGPDHDWHLDLEVLSPPADADPEQIEDFTPEPALVQGEEARLRQVLVNLLANARVHTPAGSRVVASLSRDGGNLVVRISDNGPGIDPGVRERIFERFARGDASRERGTGSTGLGMSIAQAIVASHGGTLSVDSRTEGPQRGTVFTVELPAADPQ